MAPDFLFRMGAAIAAGEPRHFTRRVRLRAAPACRLRTSEATFCFRGIGHTDHVCRPYCAGAVGVKGIGLPPATIPPQRGGRKWATLQAKGGGRAVCALAMARERRQNK